MRIRSIAISILAAASVAAVAPPIASAVVVAPTPLPVPAPRLSALLSVSCATDSSCTAAGYRRAHDRSFGLIEHWDGTGWHRQATAPGALLGPDLLVGIACASPGSCVAVGASTPSAPPGASLVERIKLQRAFPEVPVAVTESGGRWQISQPAQHHDGVTVSGLTSIACPSAGDCLAGGFGRRDGHAVGVIETLSDGRWRLTRTIAAPGVPRTTISGLSCAGVGSCVAIVAGTHAVTTRPRTATVDRLRDGQWRPAVSASGTQAALTGIGCAPGGPCLAVGVDAQPPIRSVGFVVSSAGAAPLAAPAPVDGNAVAFSRIACATATQCLAIGHLGPQLTAGTPIGVGGLSLQEWDGTTFTQVTSGTIGSLRPVGVACRPAFCMLVGGNGHATAARWPWTPPTADAVTPSPAR
jgi:hypothetical protein